VSRAHTLPSIALTAFSAAAWDEYLTKPNPFGRPVWLSLTNRTIIDKITKGKKMNLHISKELHVANRMKQLLKSIDYLPLQRQMVKTWL
jgi:hypothetical protein